MSSVQWTGVEELDRKLVQLPEKVAKKISRSAINAGLSVTASEIRKRAPRQSGTLKKSVGKRFRKDKRDKAMRAKAGINVGRKESDKRRWAPHGHLVTLGTRRRRTKSGANRGRMSADNFVARGTAVAAPKVGIKMAQKAASRLDREIEKL